jgi:hypothetical protein
MVSALMQGLKDLTSGFREETEIWIDSSTFAALVTELAVASKLRPMTNLILVVSGMWKGAWSSKLHARPAS